MDMDAVLYSSYDDSESAQLYPLILQELGEIQGRHIVDYGCGEGKLLEELIGSGGKCHGYDISQDMVERAHEKLGNTCPIECILSGDIPLQDASVDAVVSNLVLMMAKDVAELEGIYDGAHRVLKEGGEFVYTITHPAFYDKDFTVYRNIGAKDVPYLSEGFPYQFVLKKPDGSEVTDATFVDHHYPLMTYLNLTTQSGFCIVHVVEVEVPGNDFPCYILVNAIKA